MSRVIGPVGVLLGVVAIVAGVFLQLSGAAALVYCSVIGGGILLLLAGGVVWSIHAVRDRQHRTQRSRSSVGV